MNSESSSPPFTRGRWPEGPEGEGPKDDRRYFPRLLPPSNVLGRRQHRGDLQSRHPRPEGRLALGARGPASWRCWAPNGAGKSTTLKAISNLLQAERGEVTKGPDPLPRREGRWPHAQRSGAAAGVIQVMEGRHCFGHLTVEEKPADRRPSSTATSAARSPTTSRRSITIFPAPSRSAAPARPATRRAASSR